MQQEKHRGPRRGAQIASAVGVAAVTIAGASAPAGAVRHTGGSTQGDCSFGFAHDHPYSTYYVQAQTYIPIEEDDCQSFVRIQWDYGDNSTVRVEANARNIIDIASIDGWKQTVHFTRTGAGTLIGQALNP
jgi:hypothetical protein